MPDYFLLVINCLPPELGAGARVKEMLYQVRISIMIALDHRAWHRTASIQYISIRNLFPTRISISNQ
jgi:hypothetical protein